MNLEEFLAKNQLRLSAIVLSLCKEAIAKMERSKDVLHNEKHIFCLLTNLDLLLENETTIKKSEINFDVLLLAIYWHDVWRSNRLPRNFFSMIFDEIFEGLGSMLLFSKRAKEVKLPGKPTSKVKYAIRKHSRFQVFPLRSREAKILHDIDDLDLWSTTKLKALEKIYLKNPKKINPYMIKLARFYYDHFMAKTKPSTYHFQWAREEFRKRKKIFVKRVNELIAKYQYMIKGDPLSC